MRDIDSALPEMLDVFRKNGTVPDCEWEREGGDITEPESEWDNDELESKPEADQDNYEI